MRSSLSAGWTPCTPFTDRIPFAAIVISPNGSSWVQVSSPCLWSSSTA